jgi:epoxide hydrolase
MLFAAASFRLLSQGELHAQASSAPRPFRVDIPQAKIDRILARVRDAEWPDRLDAPDLRYGVSWDYMKALAKYWIEQ